MKFLNLTLSALLMTSMSIKAQDVVIIEDDSSHVETIALPEGMLVSESDLLNEPANKDNLVEVENTARTLSYDDSLIVSRLNRIPTTIEMPLNNVTRKFIDRYCNMKSSVAVMLGSSNFYMPIFEEALDKYGLPLELKYLPVIESALRPTDTSSVGAAGLWQFMIGTGKEYGLEINTLVDERRDAIKSSDAAARYLRDLYKMFGDWGLAIAAYNCGEANVQKAIQRSGNPNADYWEIYSRLPKETQGYVPAFIGATYIMNYYCEHGITPYDCTLPIESDTIVVAHEVKFSQVASVCDLNIDAIRAINPQYRRDIIPAGYSIRLPMDAVDVFIENEDSIYALKPGEISSVRRAVTEDVGASRTPAATNSEYTQTSYTSRSASRSTSKSTPSKSKSKTTRKKKNTSKSVSVREGESLSTIARKNGTTVANLRRMNNIKGSLIKPGQKIRVK